MPASEPWTISGKLHLDDPRWSVLSSTSGEGRDVACWLRELIQRPDFDRKLDAWVLLVDRIFHQFTCYETTYAAVPYLVEFASRAPADGAQDLWVTLGWIAASHERYGVPVPSDLVDAFRDALSLAEPLGVRAFLAASRDPSIDRDFALATVALSGHPVGRLVGSGLTHELAETESACPACGRDFLIGVHDDGLTTYTSLYGPYPDHGDPTQPRSLGVLRPTGGSRNSKWVAVAAALERPDALPLPWSDGWRRELDAATAQCRMGLDGGDARSVLCVVGALLALRGDLRGAARFLRLSGGVRCPACGDEHHVVEGLLELQPERTDR